jgi:hypothetical protein
MLRAGAFHPLGGFAQPKVMNASASACVKGPAEWAAVSGGLAAATTAAGTGPAGWIPQPTPRTAMISPRAHGIIDYVFGLALISSPWLLGFAREWEETWIPFIVGMGVIVSAVFTNFEYGIIRTMPLRAHLVIDVILGVSLAASPWLLGFAEIVWLPHLIGGVILIGTGLLTRRVVGPVPPLERPLPPDQHHRAGRAQHR